MRDITIILTELETEILIIALNSYNYEGLYQNQNTILDKAKEKIINQYKN